MKVCVGAGFLGPGLSSDLPSLIPPGEMELRRRRYYRQEQVGLRSRMVKGVWMLSAKCNVFDTRGTARVQVWGRNRPDWRVNASRAVWLRHACRVALCIHGTFLLQPAVVRASYKLKVLYDTSVGVRAITASQEISG